MAIDPQLTKIIDYLVKEEASVYKGIFGTEQRPWLNFKDIKEIGKYEYDGISDIFDTSASNDNYSSIKSEANGKSKELSTAKLGADFLAQFERDYRMRTRSRIRMFVHGGCRAYGNSLSNGPLRKNTIDWFSRILAEEKK